MNGKPYPGALDHIFDVGNNKKVGFCVDNFRQRDESVYSGWFLTHYHADHTVGIYKKWNHGPIYTNSITAALVRSKWGLKNNVLHELQYLQPYTIDGVKVIMLQANHCPGSSMFFFEAPNGETDLFTGDFRYDSDHPLCKSWRRLFEPTLTVTRLHIDTTFDSPKHCIPKQQLAIDKVVEIVEHLLDPSLGVRWLVVISTYTIGKERVLTAVAKATGVRIGVSTKVKYQMLQECLPKLHIPDYFTLDVTDTPVLLGQNTTGEAMNQIVMKYCGPDPSTEPKAYQDGLPYQYDRVAFIRPSGWEYTRGWERGKLKTSFINRGRDKRGVVFGVPYSEHCSYPEMVDFVKRVRPKNILLTLKPSKKESDAYVAQHFHPHMDHSENRATIDPFLKQAERQRELMGRVKERERDREGSDAESGPPGPAPAKPSSLTFDDGDGVQFRIVAPPVKAKGAKGAKVAKGASSRVAKGTPAKGTPAKGQTTPRFGVAHGESEGERERERPKKKLPASQRLANLPKIRFGRPSIPSSVDMDMDVDVVGTDIVGQTPKTSAAKGKTPRSLKAKGKTKGKGKGSSPPSAKRSPPKGVRGPTPSAASQGVLSRMLSGSHTQGYIPSAVSPTVKAIPKTKGKSKGNGRDTVREDEFDVETEEAEVVEFDCESEGSRPRPRAYSPSDVIDVD
ncbi:hypothetical protein KIPB_006989 [Kipferlia bialata]|uniref:Metallo-beta-lactamase domain-containing protein n=1 Tax=Kipferlia bialata TaxID=797122 RepID=A0A9K3CZC8_9EUKA|nr:hypothetical protein KIPB_006989 [Kipferlia bialata]|eukprot:g6989.t1